MREEHLKYLVCPEERTPLEWEAIHQRKGPVIEEALLMCPHCKQTYPVHGGIARFVSSENYAKGFGFQWLEHARTQYDSFTGVPVSTKRFFEETGWSKNLQGEVILEVGSGSGRFTEPAATTGAMVITLDYSQAVEANYASNGLKENVLIVQGDIYRMPFRLDFFDKVFCFGVLQSIPEVEKGFLQLPRYLKPGGRLSVDFYRKHKGLLGLLQTKYWVRPLTRRLPHEKLYRWIKAYISFMWPLASLINRIPKLGHRINRALLIADYRGIFDLSEELLKEWAILDTFDMLSPAYDFPQTIESVKGFFEKAPLREVEVLHGYNGIEARGVRR